MKAYILKGNVLREIDVADPLLGRPQDPQKYALKGPLPIPPELEGKFRLVYKDGKIV